MHLTQKANLSTLKIEVNLFFCLVTAKRREILGKDNNEFIQSLSGRSNKLKVPALGIKRVKIMKFYRSAADAIASLPLGTVKGLVCGLDDLMRSRVLFITLCNPDAYGHSGLIARLLVLCRVFWLLVAPVRAAQEKP